MVHIANYADDNSTYSIADSVESLLDTLENETTTMLK